MSSTLLQRLVRDDFGVDASLIVSGLLQRGALSMGDLKGLVGVPWTTLRNTVILLYKHQVLNVDLFKVPVPHGMNNGVALEPGTGSVSVKYSANVDGIFARLRQARYLMLVESLFGPVARRIVYQTVVSGWISEDDCLNAAAVNAGIPSDVALIIEGRPGSGVGGNTTVLRTLQELKAAWNELLVEGVLVRVLPFAELQPREAETGGGRGAGWKGGLGGTGRGGGGDKDSGAGGTNLMGTTVRKRKGPPKRVMTRATDAQSHSLMAVAGFPSASASASTAAMDPFFQETQDAQGTHGTLANTSPKRPVSKKAKVADAEQTLFTDTSEAESGVTSVSASGVGAAAKAKAKAPERGMGLAGAKTGGRAGAKGKTMAAAKSAGPRRSESGEGLEGQAKHKSFYELLGEGTRDEGAIIKAGGTSLDDGGLNTDGGGLSTDGGVDGVDGLDGGGGIDGMEGVGKRKSKNVYRVSVERLNFIIAKQIIESFICIRWGSQIILRMLVQALVQQARRGASGELVCQEAPFETICQAVVECAARQNKRAARSKGGGGLHVPELESVKILQVLDNMCKHSDRFVRLIRREGGVAYQLNWRRAALCLQRHVLTQALKVRFGGGAARVYNLLLDGDGKGQQLLRQRGGDNTQSLAAAHLKYTRFWYDSEVADIALMSPSNARQHLLDLAESGFIQAHQSDVVATSTGSGSASATAGGAAGLAAKQHMWAFGVREGLAHYTYTNGLIQYFLNLFERKATEVEKLQALAFQASRLTETKQLQQTKREVAEDILEASIAAIDQPFFIFTQL